MSYPPVPSFDSLQNCRAFTNSCHSNGDCQSTNQKYSCYCNNRWDPYYNCSINFYEEWAGVDTFHYVIRYLLVVAGIIMLILELANDIKKKSQLSSALISKILLFCFWVVRLVSVVLWNYFSVTRTIPYACSLVDDIFFVISLTLLLTGYLTIILMWTEILTQIKAIQVPRLVKITLLVSTGVYSPLSLLSGALYLTATLAFMENVFFIWSGIFLIGWSIYLLKSVIHLYREIKELSEKTIKLIKRKNEFLGASSVINIIYIPLMLCFLLTDANDHAWLYLGFDTVLRVLEELFAILLIFCVESSLLQIIKNFLKEWCQEKQAYTVTESDVSKQNVN